ncbi:MAG: ferritin-like domain-containing protein [Candidatus Rokubacteria bacterium]|nr:ferritin-like domain-containing protein [Candidatus Rokubacteria bacterium]
MSNAREFVRVLAAENAAFWAGKDVRLEPAAAPAERLRLIRYRMRQGVYNELRSVELIAAWIPHVPEREIRDLLPGQLDDEHRHYRLLRQRLVDLGEDPDAYRPLPEWEALFDWLVACRTRPTLEKLAMFQFAGESQSCDGFETLIEVARDVDPETAELYRTQILPDEYRHAAIGRRALQLLADTPERQAVARAACHEMNERVFAAYRAHRERADRDASSGPDPQ